MKVAVIGGGIYGSRLAYVLSSKHSVDLYEKNEQILEQAASNNQHRLHLGYHYPRSPETIEQCLEAHDIFLLEYGDCTATIDNNFYLVHRDSLVKFEEYVKTFSSFSLDHAEVELNSLDSFLNNKSQFAGAIRTKERVILLDKLKDKIKKQLSSTNVSILTKTMVKEIKEGRVVSTKGKKDYDMVINCTYNNPQMGLDMEIKTKTEACCMLLVEIKNDTFANKSFTIMDGDYGSLYPANNDGVFTISSVKNSPFLKGLTKEEISLDQCLRSKVTQEVKNNIMQDIKRYINLSEDDFTMLRPYFSLKTKLFDDYQDLRTSSYFRHGKNISVLCGKISAVFTLEDKIIREIEQ